MSECNLWPSNLKVPRSFVVQFLDAHVLYVLWSSLFRKYRTINRHYAIGNKKSLKKLNIMDDSMWRISILTYNIFIISNKKIMRGNLQGRAGHSGPSKVRFNIVQIIGFKFHSEFELDNRDIYEHLTAWHRLDFYGYDFAHGDGKRYVTTPPTSETNIFHLQHPTHIDIAVQCNAIFSFSSFWLVMVSDSKQLLQNYPYMQN